MKCTDKDILELAAVAGGFKVTQWHEDDYGIVAYVDHGDKLWIPLEDDGDAFRLAMKIGLSIKIDKAKSEVEIYFNSDLVWSSSTDSDFKGCVRRAIVRAAAVLGGLQK